MTALIDHRQPPALLLEREPGQPDAGAGAASPLAGLAQVLTVLAQAGGEVPCLENDAELWFAERPEDVESAKALCRPCPVRAACLDGALRRGEPWGVWGGEYVVAGQVVARKRPRGRPRKSVAPLTP